MPTATINVTRSNKSIAVELVRGDDVSSVIGGGGAGVTDGSKGDILVDGDDWTVQAIAGTAVEGASVGGLGSEDSGKLVQFEIDGDFSAAYINLMGGGSTEPQIYINDPNQEFGLAIMGPASLTANYEVRFPELSGNVLLDTSPQFTTNAGDIEELETSVAAKQPLDSDLTAIAALTTTSFGRGLLTETNAASLRTTAALGTLATQSGTFSGTHSGTSSGTNTGDQTTVSGNAGTATALATARTIAMTGDVTWTSGSFDGTANATSAGTLATVNGNVGSFGSATESLTLTVNAKGLVTAAAAQTVTPAVGSITGLGTGVATFLATPTFANLNTALTGDDAAGLAAANTFTGTNIISTAGAASTPSLKLSGVPFSGTGTTSFPLLYIADANATASTTLSTAGTYLGINGDGTQDLCNFLKDGTTMFKVSSTGATTCGATLTATTGSVEASVGSFMCRGTLANVGYFVNNGGSMRFTADGVLNLRNDSNNGFGRLNFGMATSGFAAIKASTTTLQIRLADDSAFTVLEMGIPKFSGTNSTGAGTALLSTNCPAVTASAPYTWISVTTSDGSAGFIPVWK